jgi:SAM-dependent methyltransferase
MPKFESVPEAGGADRPKKTDEERSDWRANTIDRSVYIDVWERGVKVYEDELRFQVNELEGQRVLNLGAGETLKFEREVREAAVRCDIVSVSPDYASEKHRKKLFVQKGRVSSLVDKLKGRAPEMILPGAQLVAAIGQDLPFPESSFDRILCSHVLEHIENKKAYQALIRESLRVLRPGGTAHFVPTTDARDAAWGLEEVLSEFPDVDLTKEEAGGSVSEWDDQGMKYKVPRKRLIFSKVRTKDEKAVTGPGNKL